MRYMLIRRLNSRVQHLWIKIKWAWQRAFRGWDDSVVIGGLDGYLTKMMPIWLAEIKQYSYPSGKSYVQARIENAPNRDERAREIWNAELDRMIEGFQAARAYGNRRWETDEEAEALLAKFHQAMQLVECEFYALYT